MNKFKMFCGDICHTANGATSEFAPLGGGCILSYFETNSPYAKYFELSLFKYPGEFIEHVLRGVPDVLALSNYIWNEDLSCQLAKEVKALNPNTLVIMGGPNFHTEDHLREKWLQQHPYVDFYVVGEGEEPLCNVVNKWYEVRDIDQLKCMPLFSVNCLVDGKLNKEGVKRHRISNLGSFPSPYIKGYMDEFLKSEFIIPEIQTERGCPYTCTFCYDGSIETNKLSQMPIEKFKEEMEYIAQRAKSKVLIICDLNFGMLENDIEVSRIIANTKQKYKYPYYVTASTAKRAGRRIKECIKILEGSLSVTASVQSLDPQVMDNIKRMNISGNQLIAIAEYANQEDTGTRSEVILGLPGDTLEKHMNTIFQLIDIGMHLILPYTLILLAGSELGTDAARKKWNMQTKFRLSHRSFGQYQFGDTEIRAAEIEEVVVGLDSMSIKDYFEARAFDLTASIFFSDSMLLELSGFLDQFGISFSQVLTKIVERKDKLLTKDLMKLYESFNNETCNELWDSREELEEYVKSLPSMTYDDKIVGHNILFKHRAIALMELVDDIVDVAFAAARDVLPPEVSKRFNDYLDELQVFCKLRKRNIFDYEQVYDHVFRYDFYQLGEEDRAYKGLAEEFSAPQRLVFYHTKMQKELFGSFATGLNGAMRILPRLAIIQTFRTVKAETEKHAVHVLKGISPAYSEDAA